MKKIFLNCRERLVSILSKILALFLSCCKYIVSLLPKFLAVCVILFSGLKMPFFQRKKRQRFKKEKEPWLKFKTWKSVAMMNGVGLILMSLLTNYLTNIIRVSLVTIITFFNSLFQKGEFIGFDMTVFLYGNLFNYRMFVAAPIISLPIFIFLVVLVIKSSYFNFKKYRDFNNNEEGDDQFVSTEDLKKEYKSVPDKTKSFSGYGGFPVGHLMGHNLYALSLKKKMTKISLVKRLSQAEKVLGLYKKLAGEYLIDDDTVNAIIIGMTRSGKGETIVNTMLDIISRAEKQSAMIIGDPKGELYQSSYKTLRKRGYDVEVLSFQNMDWSMSYNPLALAVEYAKKGYYEDVQAQVLSVANAIFAEKDAKDKFWQNSNIGLFQATAIALIDRAKETEYEEDDAWATITIRNILQFITDLGSQEVLVDGNGEIVTDPQPQQQLLKKSKLTLYFEELKRVNEKKASKFRNMAIAIFQGTDFASEETKGNIYTGFFSGLTLYLQDNIAKLTSKNSIKLETIGHPRILNVRFRSSTMEDAANKFAHQTAVVKFVDENGKTLIKETKSIIDINGYINFVVSPVLPEKFKIIIDINGETWELDNKKLYEKKGLGKNSYILDEYSGKKIIKGIQTSIAKSPKGSLLEKKDIDFSYSEKPKAIFLVTPPNKVVYNSIVSLFIDQVFNVNYELALSAGRKTVDRIQFILDEFANLPTIPDMDKKLSIGLGQNILFTMIIQNLKQLNEKYGENIAETIVENCSIQAFIKSTSKETAQSFEDKLGTKTITKRSAGVQDEEGKPNISTQAQPLLTKNQLLKLQSGEMVIVRGVKATDQKGNKITPDPIFVHGDLEMPYRFMFLQEEFDMDMTLSDIPVKSLHRGMKLSDVVVDGGKSFDHLQIWSKELQKERLGTKSGQDILPKLKTRYAA